MVRILLLRSKDRTMTLKMNYKKSSEMSKINGTYFIGYDKIYASGLKKITSREHLWFLQSIQRSTLEHLCMAGKGINYL
jgi:hypothetical protein